MAGAIRTSLQNEAYDEGWERAFGREASFNRLWEQLVTKAKKNVYGETSGAGDREPRVSDPEGSTEPEAEQAAPRELAEVIAEQVVADVDAHAQWHDEHPGEEHVSAEEAWRTWQEGIDPKPPRERETAAHAPAPYACPTCGWHLAYSSEKCGNATCPRGRSTYVTRS